jgi:hypothetical protein
VEADKHSECNVDVVTAADGLSTALRSDIARCIQFLHGVHPLEGRAKVFRSRTTAGFLNTREVNRMRNRSIEGKQKCKSV